MPISPYYRGGANVQVTDGGTEADTAPGARTNLGTTLENILSEGNATNGNDIVLSSGDSLTGAGTMGLSGPANFGNVFDATVSGDIAAGTIGSGHWAYIQSTNTFSFYNGGGTLQTTFNLSTALATTSQEIIGAINEVNALAAASPPLSTVLGVGNNTGAADIVIDTGRQIDGGRANFGTTTSAVADGDLAAGVGSTNLYFNASLGDLTLTDGVRNLTWDASVGTLYLTTGSGALNVGAGVTPSTENGDFRAGDGTGTFRWKAGGSGAGLVVAERDHNFTTGYAAYNLNVSSGAFASYTATSDSADIRVLVSNSLAAIPSAAFFDTTTGSALYLRTIPASPIHFRTTNTDRWTISSGGDLLAGDGASSADNSLDIGASGDNRPRTIYVGTSVVVGSTVTVTTDSVDASGALNIGASTATAVTIGNTSSTSPISLLGGVHVGAPTGGPAGDTELRLGSAGGGNTVINPGRIIFDKFNVLANDTEDASGNAQIVLRANTTGTATAGFGTEIRYNLERADGVLQQAGSLKLVWTDASASDSAYEFHARDGGLNSLVAVGRGSDQTIRIEGGLEVGTSAGTITGAGDIVAGDGTRLLSFDPSTSTFHYTGIDANSSDGNLLVEGGYNGDVRLRVRNTWTGTAARATLNVSADASLNLTLSTNNTSHSTSPSSSAIATGNFVLNGLTVGTVNTAGAAHLTFQTAGTDRWRIDATDATTGGTSGHLLAVTDNAYDIGAGGATRPRSVYIGTSLGVTSAAPTGPGEIECSDGTSRLAFDNSSGSTGGRLIVQRVGQNTTQFHCGQGRNNIDALSEGNSTSWNPYMLKLTSTASAAPVAGQGSSVLFVASAQTPTTGIPQASIISEWAGAPVGTTVDGRLILGVRDGGAGPSANPMLTLNADEASVHGALNVGNGITASTANGDIVAGDANNELAWDSDRAFLSVAGVPSYTKSTGFKDVVGYYLNGQTGADFQMVIEHASNGVSDCPTFTGFRSRGTLSPVARTAMVAGDRLLHLNCVAYDGSADQNVGGIAFHATNNFADATPGPEERTTHLDFNLASGTSFATRMRLTGPGGLEVGTITGTADQGDIVAGDGTRELSWDADTQLLSLRTNTSIASNNSAQDVIFINGEGTDNRRVTIRTAGSSGGGNGAAFRGERARNTLAVPQAVDQFDNLLTMIGQGYDGSAYATGSVIYLRAEGLWSGTSHPSRIELATCDVSSTVVASRWAVNPPGHFVASDTSKDIGLATEVPASSEYRPRDLFLSRGLVVGSNITTTPAEGDIVAGDGTRELSWNAALGQIAVSGAAPGGTYTPISIVANHNGYNLVRMDNNSTGTAARGDFAVITDGGEYCAFGATGTNFSGNLLADVGYVNCTQAAGFMLRVANTTGDIRFGGGSGPFGTKWMVDSTTNGSHFLPGADSTYNIGASGTRVLNVYTDRLSVGTGSAAADGDIVAGDPTRSLAYTASTNLLRMAGDQNATTMLELENDSTGALARATLRLGSNAGDCSISAVSSAYTDPSSMQIIAGTGMTGGILINAFDASGTIAFRTGATGTARWLIGSNGNLVPGNTDTFNLGGTSNRVLNTYTNRLSVGTGVAADLGDIVAGDGTNELLYDASAHTLQGTEANGATWTTETVSHLFSAVSGASVTASSLIPDGALVLGVTSKVTVALGGGGGTTGYRVGDGTDADRWGVEVGLTTAANTVPADFTDNTVQWQTGGAGDVVITADGGNFNGTGNIRVVVTYMTLTAPTS